MNFIHSILRSRKVFFASVPLAAIVLNESHKVSLSSESLWMMVCLSAFLIAANAMEDFAEKSAASEITIIEDEDDDNGIQI